MDLKGKNVLLTGASRGIGPFIARALARGKAHVMISATTGSVGQLEALAQECRGLGAEVDVICADLTDKNQRKTLIRHAREIRGPIDILINNAGLEHSGPALVTPELLVKLKALVPLAPLHQPRNLEPIESLGASHPHVPQVVCFDTAFHQTLPRVAQMYALPKALRDAGAHRYGFHGLSYEYIASRLPDIDRRGATGRTIVAHLGSGASMCALRSGRSIATTMGFSPLSGLVMGTRPGDLDPGLMIWLNRERGMSVDQIEATLYHDAGLKGVSGISGDMRQLLASDTPEASEVVELFAYKAATEVGALTAALGGLDTLVFTAGIGERSPEVRAMICARCKWLGLEVSMARNQAGSSTISTPDSRVAVHVIATNEELMVARHTIDLVLKRMLKESVQ